MVVEMTCNKKEWDLVWIYLADIIIRDISAARPLNHVHYINPRKRIPTLTTIIHTPDPQLLPI